MSEKSKPKKAAKKPVGRPSKNLKYTSIALSQEADNYWNALAEELGVSKIAVLELAIRQLAKVNGVK